MARKSYNQTTQNARLRGRIVLIGLLLALAIGSVNLPAQAAPAGALWRYRLDTRILRGEDEICLGDAVHIRVWVYREEDAGNNVQYISGVRVVASLSNAGIGRLNPISTDTGISSDRPGEIDYRFTAEKVGKTVISFKGTINHKWFGLASGTFTLESRVTITVVECQYKVSAVSRFESSPDFFVVGAFKDVVMRLDAQGLYAGTATVNWSGYWRDQTGPCTHYFEAPASSKAELIGLMDEIGNLEVNIVYTEQEGAWHTACRNTPITDDRVPEKLDPTELKFVVPVYGEVGKLLYQQIEMLGGKATISVVPEKAGSGQ